MKLNYFERKYLEHQAILEREDISRIDLVKYELGHSNIFDWTIDLIGSFSLLIKLRKVDVVPKLTKKV